MRYDAQLDELYAQGNVHMRNRLNEISGPEMLFRRDSATGYFHDPRFAIAYISTICTLRPGDVISTGTPAGVGMGMDPPTFLARGQTVRCSIAGIGELVNRCV